MKSAELKESLRNEERSHPKYWGLRFGSKPVFDTGLEHLDHRRLRDYLGRILNGVVPPLEDTQQWEKLLQNLCFATATPDGFAITVDGMLLFGKDPRRFLPQSGIQAVCYKNDEPGGTVRANESIDGPLVSLSTIEGWLFETGLVDRGHDFIRRNTISMTRLKGAQPYQSWEYPEDAVRELLVNAVVHRDYTILSKVELSIYSDCLEIQSPGRLPNRVTTDKVRSGLRYARNQTLMNVMRDYRYIDDQGMAIRKTVIPGMRAHNGTEPEFIEEESRFTVRLWKEPRA